MHFLLHQMNSMKNKLLNEIIGRAHNLDVFKANIIDTQEIETKRVFRDICESNACGMYGKCYMCPPDVGDIDMLMAQLKKYDYAFVYQTVSNIEDSFDFEGMMEAKKKSYSIAKAFRCIFLEMGISNALHLGAGGCGVCEQCAKQIGEPCRFPEIAIPSLEAYGINVSSLAKTADMNYINGQNTVTFFGAVLFSIDGE